VVRRDRHDIVVDILKKAAYGRKKTELMADVGLSYLQTKQYLETLIDKGMLQADTHKVLRTTPKGLEFLNKCTECLLLPWEKQKKKT
jgi:predicted transcriptional regulator